MGKDIPFKSKNTNSSNSSDPSTSTEVVRRFELTGILKQIVDNVNEIAKHLMNDVNVLFKRFVYPILMRTNAIENLLINKGIMTKEEINDETKRLTEEAIAKAKEIDENGKLKDQSSGAPGDGIKAEEKADIEKIHPEIVE